MLQKEIFQNERDKKLCIFQLKPKDSFCTKGLQRGPCENIHLTKQLQKNLQKKHLLLPLLKFTYSKRD